MYFGMLKRDLKDKPGLNIVAFIFMIASVMFMVIGSTLLYSIFAGEKNTYKKCNTSDVYFFMDKDMADAEGQVERFERDLDKIGIFTEYTSVESVFMNFSSIGFIGEDIEEDVHYTAGVFVGSVPHDYDIPIDFDNNYFEVEDGCIAIPQVMSNRLNVKVGDKVRLTTQMGNTYEYVVSIIFKNPAAAERSRLYLSDGDTEKFYSECPYKKVIFPSMITPDVDDYIMVLRDNSTDIIVDYARYNADGQASQILFMNNDGLFSIIVMMSMLIVAVAVMIMTMITIDFSLKSAIRREEREIGMMKAIGVWSLSYKTLFIVKYLAFAVVGGAIGLPLGFFLSKLLFRKFVMNIMFPDAVMMTIIGLSACLLTILVIALFSFFALRRMNKVSVIDAIHGENRGERFSALPGPTLNNKKILPVPLFLAVSDIMRSFKRYILLVLAYVLGICIVLFVVRLSDSIMTTDYAEHYFQQGSLDFIVKIDDAYYDKLVSGTGSFTGAIDLINKDFEDNDIPAKIAVYNEGESVLKYNGGETIAVMRWMDSPSSEIQYIEGNAPVLKNEVAIGYYSAMEKGIKVGDTVTVEYSKYADDHTTFNRVSEDFIITGIVDRFGAHSPTLFMGDEFEGSLVAGGDFFSAKLDVPADQYEEYIQKMQAIYPNGEVTILRNEEIMPYYLTGYQQMFALIIFIVSLTCAVVICLLTALYENIFIDEETADIALLKSMGFGRGTIRAWHFLRLMILALISLGLTYIFMVTGGNLIIGKLFTNVMKCYSFKFKVQPISNFVILPLCVLTGLAIIIYLMSMLTNKIQIWKVRNE